MKIEYKPKITEIFMMIAILFGVVALAVLLFRGFKSIFNNPKLWFIGSCVIYAICMGGLVHNIIHNVPFTSVDANGNVEWKTSGGRQQLGAEGFVMSVCITCVGLTMILYHRILKAKVIADE
jgi:OST3 / OST6 family, transporter family